MVKVAILGAGTIGGAIARALARNGHTVLVFVRNPDANVDLAKTDGITVLKGDSQDLAALGESFQAHRPSVLIDNWSDNSDDPADVRVLPLFASAGGRRAIFTSGCLVFNYPGHVLDDNAVPNNKLGSKRIAIENAFLGQKDIEGVVIRPGWVYGNKGSYLFQLWATPQADGKVHYHGSKTKAWGYVHEDDLAAAYVLLAEYPLSLAGQAFNVADSTRLSFEGLQQLHSRVTGHVAQWDELPPFSGETFFFHFMETDCVQGGAKIRALGWRPGHENYADYVDGCWRSFQAAQGRKADAAQAAPAPVQEPAPATHHLSCVCGAVKATLTGAPSANALCHCSVCRRLGSDYVRWAVFPPPAFALVQGEPQTYHSGLSTLWFCPDCGTKLWKRPQDGSSGPYICSAAAFHLQEGKLPESWTANLFHLYYANRVTDVDDGQAKFINAPQPLGGDGVLFTA
jgi:nucleoside-diphosphate-sugar epimerase